MLSEFPPKSFALTSRRRFHSHALTTNALRFFWVVIVIVGELGVFFWSLAGCRWPTVSLGHKTRQPLQSTHVLLVADPQVQHPALTAKGSSWASLMRRVMFELNLRKSWHVASRLQPHAVVFLGDMLANGKAAQSLEEYDQAVQKFKSIFSIHDETAVYYVPGNNDVGLGFATPTSQKLKSFYVKSFGPLNQNFVISNHTFVALNAPGLVDEDYQRHAASVGFDEWSPIPNGAVSFVNNVAEYDPGHIILLSHIPLSRSEMAECGPLREKGVIHRGAGPGYQNMLGKQTTNFLFKNLHPLIIFSADNRDYCEYVHQLPHNEDAYRRSDSIREVTLKSFSMSVHIKRPGFQLLTLVDPSKIHNPDLPSFAEVPCLLPDQYKVYTSFYTPLLCFTLLILVILNLRARATGRFRGKPRNLSLTPSPRSSGRSSPNPLFHPDPAQWSATWSPYSPTLANGVPSSPRGTLPPYLRTPRSQNNSTTHLVASRPGTPGPSSPSTLTVPILPPFSDRNAEEEGYEDDDTMYPTQYALRPESRRVSRDGAWAHVGHQTSLSEDYDLVHDHEAGGGSSRVHNEFTSAPAMFSSTSGLTSKSGRWSKSYTFAFRGRMRRITLGLPSSNSLHNLLDLFGLGNDSSGVGLKRNKNGTAMLLLDALSVFWPSVVVWVIINWTIL